MLAGSVIAVIALVVLAALISFFFTASLIVVLLNAILLYALLLRAYADLQKGRWQWYLAALVIAALVVYQMKSLPPFWPITLVVILVFLMIEIARAFGAFKPQSKRRR